MFALRLIVTFAALVVAVVLPAFAEEIARPQAKITASVQDGFARLMFDWNEEVSGIAQVGDGVLIITFDRSFDADTGALAKALEPYVALVRRDADGRSLRFALKGPVRVKTTNHAVRYAFDLVPPSFKGDPAPPPAPDGVKAKQLLTVRVTERERTTRLQFDYTGKIGYTAKLADGILQVNFTKPAKVNLTRFSEAPPAWIRAARSSIVEGKLRLEFDVDREADFRDVSENGQIALELLEPKSDATAAAERLKAEGAPKIIIPEATENSPAPPVLIADAIVFAPLPRKGAEATAAPTDEPAGQSALAPDVALGDGAALLAAVTEAQSGDALPPNLRLGQSDLSAALAPLVSSTPAVAGKARAEIFGSMLRLELPYSKLPAAAIFRRGLAVWVVVETTEAMDLSGLSALVNSPARALSAPAEVAPGVTGFRLEAPVSMSVSAAAVGNSWVVAVGNTVPDLPAQLQLVRQTVGSATKMRAFMPGATQVVWLKDPEVEDRMAAVLSFAPARGLLDMRSFVEFAALPSQQGLVVQAIADDLAVVVEGDEVVIARPAGLSVSAAQFVQALATSQSAFPSTGGFGAVNFAAWGKRIKATREETVSELLRQSSQTLGGMSPPRMALARFFIAEGLGAEALGVLRNISHDDRTAEANPQFRVARALANIQMARYREALDDLKIDALGNDPHAALWRGIAAAGAREWRLARSNLMTALKIVSRYEPEWQGRARVALAKAALALDEPGTARQILEAMPRKSLSARVTAEAALERAMIEGAFKKTDAAIAHFDQLMNSTYSPVAARATLEGTLLKAKSGRLKIELAIETLERLRFQWRGDEIELKTLTELGQLYVAHNKIRDGLNTMRLAVRHFSDSEEARTTAAQMAKIFESLFIGGKADHLSPVAALALFYDYKELTPVGPQGDDMIRKLAERLAAIDLLPQAAELLQHQVDNRLDGVAKASVATRLALVYLLDHEPGKALAAIRSSKQTRLPDDLIVQRDLIEARALADTKNFDQALDVIATDLSLEADRLRADIYWDSQRWPAAAAKTEALLDTRYKDDKPLSAVERMDLMRACVGYSLSGDSASLERLRSRFNAKMAMSPEAKAFAMITHSPDVTNDDYKSLVKRVASADTLDEFLTEFKSRYGTGGPAATATP